MSDVANDFYEDDEPLADVLTAFERGPQGRTAPTIPAGGYIVTAPNTFAQTVTPSGFRPVENVQRRLTTV